MFKYLISSAILTGMLFCGVTQASAERASVAGKDAFAKERFMVRARAIGIVPQERSTVNIGGETKVGNSLTPEVDLTYFFTDNISAEVIAATAQHSVYYNGASMGRVWVLPPTVTLQYHFMPEKAFNPYVGAGLNYSIFYNEKGTNFTNFDVGNGPGVALQAGADYWLNDKWGVNFDVKKIFLNFDASVLNGVARSDISLDPWVIGAGVSYHF